MDITQEVCPLTFVKTKLRLEKLSNGQTLAVRLVGKEPLENVPRSVAEQGDRVLALHAEIESDRSGDPAAVHLLLIQRNRK